MSKVYILGATGGVGAQVVKELLERQVPTTVLVRDPSKAASLFGKQDNLNIVQGDYDNVDNFRATIPGHERLFILVKDIDSMSKIKVTFAKMAYEAGVKQIVDISSISVSGPYRENYIAAAHYFSEDAIYKLPIRGNYVALRPTSFFSNHFFGDNKTVQYKGIITGHQGPDEKMSWISTTDIAHLAVKIMTEPVEKHVDMVYNLTSVSMSGNERAAAISRAIGKEIKYVQVPFEQQYKAMVEFAQMPHYLVFGLLAGNNDSSSVNEGLPLLLNRPTETLEEWITANKSAFGA
ncbi:hypothetical protein NQZ79_g6375 [Umbelopsis isabellina]|nr:hypothetical protein NQZ79_g6375 [Umbelopsis isabellina]